MITEKERPVGPARSHGSLTVNKASRSSVFRRKRKQIQSFFSAPPVKQYFCIVRELCVAVGGVLPVAAGSPDQDPLPVGVGGIGLQRAVAAGLVHVKFGGQNDGFVGAVLVGPVPEGGLVVSGVAQLGEGAAVEVLTEVFDDRRRRCPPLYRGRSPRSGRSR